MMAYLGLIKAAAAVLVAIALFGYGVVVGEGRVQTRWDKVKVAQALVDAKAADHMNDIAAQLETAKNERQIVTKTITKRVIELVDRPVYRNVCLDDDGLQLINAALAGKGPSVAPAAVPTVKPVDGSNGQRPADKHN